MEWCLVAVWIHVSLMAADVPLPMHFLDICVSSLENVYLDPLPIFFRFYFFIFGERVGEGERGEKHRSVASCMPPTGDLAGNPGMCPDWE